MMSPPVSFPAGLRLANSSGAMKQNRGWLQSICEPRKRARANVMLARVRNTFGGRGRMVLYKQMKDNIP